MKHVAIALGSTTVLLLIACEAPRPQVTFHDACSVAGGDAAANASLAGIGLVVGLNGTGDGPRAPTLAAIARQRELDHTFDANPEDVAIVIVGTSLPSSTSDRLECVVHGVFAISIEDGQLLATPLINTQPGTDRKPCAIAEGRVVRSQANELVGTVCAKVSPGSKPERDQQR